MIIGNALTLTHSVPYQLPGPEEIPLFTVLRMSGYIISKSSSDFVLYDSESFPDVFCQCVPNNAYMAIIVSFGANGHVQTYYLQRLIVIRQIYMV